jgi:hypothetical protein
LGAARTVTGTDDAEQEAVMFRILELHSQSSAAPTQVGEGFATWDDALVAIKRHLKRFKVSGRNPEGSYWWTRDADGLRKCWISENQEGASEALGSETANGARPAPEHDPAR